MMATNTPSPQSGAPDTDHIDLGESVAGEEDPGASIDVPDAEASPAMGPGDEALPAAPGPGEEVCPDCGGSGKRDGQDCHTCQGTGGVIVGVGGA
jgi:hypothetical protein